MGLWSFEYREDSAYRRKEDSAYRRRTLRKLVREIECPNSDHTWPKWLNPRRLYPDFFFHGVLTGGYHLSVYAENFKRGNVNMQR